MRPCVHFVCASLYTIALTLAGCGSAASERKAEVAPAAPAPSSPQQSQRPASCPLVAEAPEPLPGITAEERTLDYWLAHTEDIDEVLLSPAEIRSLNEALASPRDGYRPQRGLALEPDTVTLSREVDERLSFLASKLANGEYVGSKQGGGDLEAVTRRPPSTTLEGAKGSFHVALGIVQLHCFPTTLEVVSTKTAYRYDRNACSAARPQELVRIVAEWPNGMRLAETRYSMGWIASGAPVSPALPPALVNTYLEAPRRLVAAGRHAGVGGVELNLTEPALLPESAGKLVFAAESGFGRLPAKGHQPTSTTPLTRRAMLEHAFSFIDQPYGFGGKDGGRDCSRLTLDLFSRFGIRMPRYSAWQGRSGTFSIDLAEANEKQRRRIIDAAAEHGVVMLHLPGHIMLYLGRNASGRQLVLHALGEYAEPCEGGEKLETVRRVGRVDVSDLTLSSGSARRSLIERIDRLVVLGKPPGPSLAGIAELRPAAAVEPPSHRSCTARESKRATLFFSPDTPNRKQPLRVIATSSEPLGPLDLVLVDPSGNKLRPQLATTSGPPYGYITQVDEPSPGRWRAILGDGEQIHQCARTRVRSSPKKARVLTPNEEIWQPMRAWSKATENLFAVWIERLFDRPDAAEEPTWESLQPLLRDRTRNFLYGHIAIGDDDAVELLADCADLHYVLRSYFSWKMRLPFALRSCSRARNGRPPRCPSREADSTMTLAELGITPQTSEGKNDHLGNEVAAFEEFSNRTIRRAAHSSSARTRPRDEETDYYPVQLQRESLVPGTLFADPYGHLLTIVKWVPQTIAGYGVLVAADAQPDGTVGLRRFWRGSFLFHPETNAGGAGFKAFRPRVVEGDELRPLTNKELERSKTFARFSDEQYEGDAESFYRRVEALINPRPLDPIARQRALIDAFEEQVARRVVSIDNGEDFMRKRGFNPIDMPSGASIFLTTGPWEDYSTPSRDLRLLIALDTVIGFPDVVASAPERFGVSPGNVNREVEAVRDFLRSELEGRSIEYTGSHGATYRRSLADIVDRRVQLEMAYNPNDCVEIRWLAVPGSKEMASCRRRAPEEQRQRMAEYRGWFSSRRRPAN